MELADPNSDLTIPKDVRLEIKSSFKIGRMDIMRKVALIEMGMLRRLTEDDLIEELNMTREAFVAFKRNNRPKIEAFKEDIRGSKYNLMQSINERMNIANAYTQAVLTGDKEMEEKSKTILKTLEKILPMNQLQTIGQILEKIDDVPKDDGGSAKIQINVHSPAAEAQRKLEEIKKAKQIDV